LESTEQNVGICGVLRERNHFRQRTHVGVKIVEWIWRITGSNRARRAVQSAINATVIAEVLPHGIGGRKIKAMLVGVHVRGRSRRIALINKSEILPTAAVLTRSYRALVNIARSDQDISIVSVRYSSDPQVVVALNDLVGRGVVHDWRC